MMKRRLLHTILCCLGLWVLSFLPQQTQAQQVAVKTNGLMWAAMMTNVATEFVGG